MADIKLSQKFYQAVEHVSILHKDQKRKFSDAPYATHLFGVAMLIHEYGGDEEEIIAALYHDTLEDQRDKITADDIEKLHGPRVRRLVEGVTENVGLPGHVKNPWQQRKDGYIAHVAASAADVAFLSCADKLHNLRCLVDNLRDYGPSVWASYTSTAEETIWFNEQLANIYVAKLQNPIAQQFLKELQQFKKDLGFATTPCPYPNRQPLP